MSNVKTYYSVNKDFIKQLRSDMNMTQSQLANIFSITPPTIQNWESGKTEPNPTQSAMLLQLRKKADAYLKKSKEKEISDNIKTILIGGGMLALLIWLFSRDE